MLRKTFVLKPPANSALERTSARRSVSLFALVARRAEAAQL